MKTMKQESGQLQCGGSATRATSSSRLCITAWSQLVETRRLTIRNPKTQRNGLRNARKPRQKDFMRGCIQAAKSAGVQGGPCEPSRNAKNRSPHSAKSQKR